MAGPLHPPGAAPIMKGRAEGGLMFDRLLTSNRRDFTLLEWAERDGWLENITELLPFEIAILAFPYTRIDEDKNPKDYKRGLSDFLAFCDALYCATDRGELPSYPIRLADYKPRFLFESPFPYDDDDFDGKPYSRDRYLLPFEWIQFRQRISDPCDHKYNKIVSPLILREDIRAWLLHTVSEPLDRSNHLVRWISENQERTCEAKEKSGERYLSASIQTRREIVLMEWIENKERELERFDRNRVDLSSSEIWEDLRKIDNKLFPPSSSETIQKFFKSQKICSLKRGRRRNTRFT
jgi:hypothetical protein